MSGRSGRTATGGSGWASGNGTHRAGSRARRPLPMACYYGWPSMVNGSEGDVLRAAGQFSCFESAVLGDATLTPSADPGAAQLLSLIAGCCRVYGYLSLGLGPDQPSWSDSTLQKKFEQWVALGVHGLFLDCAGRDFGVSPRRLGRAVGAAHALGVPVVVNAWDPVDLLAPGVALCERDGYLAENDVLRAGEFRPPRTYRQRLQTIERCRQWLGVSVWAIGTVAGPDDAGIGYDGDGYGPDLVDRIVLAWERAGARAPDRLTIADPLYGAADNRMPLPPDPHRPDRRYEAELIRSE